MVTVEKQSGDRQRTASKWVSPERYYCVNCEHDAEMCDRCEYQYSDWIDAQEDIWRDM